MKIKWMHRCTHGLSPTRSKSNSKLSAPLLPLHAIAQLWLDSRLVPRLKPTTVRKVSSLWEKKKLWNLTLSDWLEWIEMSCSKNTWKFLGGTLNSHYTQLQVVQHANGFLLFSMDNVFRIISSFHKQRLTDQPLTHP